MKLLDYVELMKEMYTPVAIAGVAILCLFLLFIFLKMLGGMIRGGGRQLVRTCATAAAAIVSFVAAALLSNSIIGALNVETLGGAIDFIDSHIEGSGEFIRDLFAIVNTEALEYIILLPAAVFVLPLLATLIFIVINLIFKLIRSIVIKVMKLKKATNNAQRLGGALLAVVEALIWITMITLPITAVTTLADDIFTEVVENEEEGSEVSNIYNEYILPIAKNPAVSLVSNYGSETILNGIATVSINGRMTNLRGEILSMARVIIHDVAELRGVNWQCPDEADREAIDSILTALSNSPYTSQMIVGVLCAVPSAIENNLFPINFGIGYENLLNEFVHYFAGITGETLSRDLNTVKEIYFAICDSGLGDALKDGGDIMTLLQEQRREGDDTVSKIIAILKSNPRTSPMITALTEALITTLSTGETQNGVTVSYESLKNGMTTVLSVKEENYETKEEYLDNLSGTLDTTLRDHGIELEREIVDSIAEYVDENYSHTVELSDEEFNDVLLHYYDAYLEYLDTGVVPDGLPDGVINGSGE